MNNRRDKGEIDQKINKFGFSKSNIFRWSGIFYYKNTDGCFLGSFKT